MSNTCFHLHPFFADQYRYAAAAFNSAAHDPEDSVMVSFTEQEINLVTLALILLSAYEHSAYYFVGELRNKLADCIEAQKFAGGEGGEQ